MPKFAVAKRHSWLLLRRVIGKLLVLNNTSVNVNVKDSTDCTALILASELGHYAICSRVECEGFARS
jgi:hypothetical protein